MGAIAIAAIIRSIPYAIPIRAADLVQDDRAVTLTDRQGAYLGTLLSRDREHTAVVALDDVSNAFKQAILAAEDGRFYQHGPLDLRAIVRATWQLARYRRVVSGASTVTMQLASMLDPAPRTPAAKLQQVWQSWRLAAGMTRDQILHAYVNRLPMGGNIYGVEAAAQLYFGMSASDLDVTRASLLAALPNDPTRLNPHTGWEALKQRQAYVLDRMVADGYISQAQRDRAYAERPPLQPRQQGIVAAPHFLFWTAAGLSGDRPPVVRLTLHLALQQFVEVQVREIVRILADRDVKHAAALVLDRRSGEVLAYVGAPDYFDGAGRNDGVQALRQPGSTLKPFLYALALERRSIRPQTILADVPVRYAIPGARLYSPADYTKTYQGPVRVRVALANSLNVPAVRVLEEVGVVSFLERLRVLGFEHLDRPAAHYGLGLALGSGEVSLWELATAYGTMASKGDEFVPVAIANPEEPQTNIPASVGAPDVWAWVTDVLSDRFARAKAFGIDSALTLPFPAAVKTGTSSGYRDAWTVGFTSEYVVATWMGNFDGAPMQQVSGAAGAAPLWHRIMLHLYRDRLPASLAKPAALVRRSICALTGLPPDSDCPTVTNEYLFPEDAAEYDLQAATPPPFELPSRYDEWLANQPRSPLASEQVSILFPQQDDVFLLKSTSAGMGQQVQFQISNPSGETVSWWLGDRLIAEHSAAEVYWTLQPGEWTLRVQQGDRADEVTFRVQNVPQRQQRQGFSVAP